MGIHVEDTHDPTVTCLTEGELAAIPFLNIAEDPGTRADEKVLALRNYDDNVIVVSGDVAAFARNVWRAVFDQEPLTPTNRNENS